MSARSFLAFVAVLCVVGLLGFGLLSKESGGTEVGDPAPVMDLPALGGEGSGSLADYRGDWVLVTSGRPGVAPAARNRRRSSASTAETAGG